MFRAVRKKGQGVTGEFAIVVVLVVIAISVMSTYVRRALQARYHDANRMAYKQAAGILGKNVLAEYEPYYVNTTTDVESRSTQTTATDVAGVVDGDNELNRKVISVSVQLPF